MPSTWPHNARTDVDADAHTQTNTNETLRPVGIWKGRACVVPGRPSSVVAAQSHFPAKWKKLALINR